MIILTKTTIATKDFSVLFFTLVLAHHATRVGQTNCYAISVALYTTKVTSFCRKILQIYSRKYISYMVMESK